jgi:hypothetical protein
MDWIPQRLTTYYDKLQEYYAWYSGDINTLSNYYTNYMINNTAYDGSYWKNQSIIYKRSVMHLPIANDLASSSASFLFGKTPRFYVNAADEEDNGEMDPRFEEIMYWNQIGTLLTETAEIAAAFGGVFLKLDYDPAIGNYPLISTVTPLNAVGYFYRKTLYAFDSWRVVYQDTTQGSSEIWRLFERRRLINGRLNITFTLYKGDTYGIGQKRNFSELEETKYLNLQTVDSPINNLGIIYIPNLKPNTMFINEEVGQSDYHNIIPMMDALDEAWSSWMRDIRLAGAKVFIDKALLDSSKNFDYLQEMYMKMDFGEREITGQSYDPVTMIQPMIRYTEHYGTCETLAKDIVIRAGYSPQSFGYDMKTYTESGSAQRTKEKKTIITTSKKQKYWEYGLRSLFTYIQSWDEFINGSSFTQIPLVRYNDMLALDSSVLSETIRNLSQAYAVSTYVKVKTQYPEWTEAQINEEVERIQKEINSGAKQNMSLANEKILGGQDANGRGDESPDRASDSTESE